MYGLCVIYRMDNLTGRNCVGCYYLRSYWNTIQYEYSCSGTAHRKMSAGANCRLSTTETDYQSPNIKRQTTDVQRPTVVVKRHPPVLLQSTSHEQNPAQSSHRIHSRACRGASGIPISIPLDLDKSARLPGREGVASKGLILGPNRVEWDPDDATPIYRRIASRDFTDQAERSGERGAKQAPSRREKCA
jgi:hypothetical protein